MLRTALIKTNTSKRETIVDLFTKMLAEQVVDAFLVAAKNPHSSIMMPTLITDSKDMHLADPLAPVAPFNSARQAAVVTKESLAKNIAVVLRPCEVRAFIELIKLKQCQKENVTIISMECLGRMENDLYLGYMENDPELTEHFLSGGQLHDHICEACHMCDHFLPQAADLVIGILGCKDNELGFYAQTPAAEKMMEVLKLDPADPPQNRESAVNALLEKRVKFRDEVFGTTANQVRDIKTFESIVANCINCYNCRTACPVCYCKECVFLTDVFVHQPDSLLTRAQKKGSIKIPVDTTMFHMTRLVHMGHACVGCGQCSSVCPNQIPVARIFRTVSARVQQAYGYQPGRNVADPIPVLAYQNANQKDKLS